MPSIPGQINFPTTLDDVVSLLDIKNRAATTLTGSFNSASDVAMNVASTTTFATTGYATVGDNRIGYTGKTTTTLTGCFLVADGGVAMAHSAGTAVEQRITARHLTALRDAILAIETILGPNGTNVQAADADLAAIAALIDPNADRMLFWDDSAGAYKHLTAGTGLTITETTIAAATGTGSGDVVGPASATDNAVVRFDGTTGKLLQNSTNATVSDAGVVTANLVDFGGQVYNIKAYGAVGDGLVHPLSEFYSTLAVARTVYPHALALTDSIDWAALQGAINAAYAAGGGVAFIPQGRFWMNRRVDVKSRVQVIGVYRAYQDLQNQNRKDSIRIDQVRSSLFLIDHGGGAAAVDGLATDGYTNAAFSLSGNSPAVMGVGVYYPNQIKPYEWWRTNDNGTGVTYGNVSTRAYWNTNPTPANPWDTSYRVRQIQPTGGFGSNRLYELDRFNSTNGSKTSGTTQPNWLLAPLSGDEIVDGDLVWKNIGQQSRQPTVYPPTFTCDESDGGDAAVMSPTLSDLWLPNPYEGIRFSEQNNGPLFENILMGAFRRGLYIDQCPEVPYFNRIHLSTRMNWADGEADDKFGQVTSTVEFVRLNLVGFEFRGAVWIAANDLFVHRAKDAYYFHDGVDVDFTAPRGTFIRCGCERLTGTGYLFDSTESKEGVQLIGCSVGAGDNGPAIHLKGGGTEAPFVRVWGGQLTGGGITRHVWTQSGQLQLTDVQVPPAANATIANVDVAAGTESLHMKGMIFDNTGVGLQVASGLTSRVFLIGNDLKAATYSPPATLPTTYRAVGNVGIPDIDPNLIIESTNTSTATNTTAVNLFSVAMSTLTPANDSEYRVRMRGIIENSAAGGTLTLRIRIGTDTLATVNVATLATVQTSRLFDLEAKFYIESPGVAAIAGAFMEVRDNSGAAAGRLTAGSSLAAPATVDTTTENLTVQAFWGATDAANIVTRQYVRVNRIR